MLPSMSKPVDWPASTAWRNSRVGRSRRCVACAGSAPSSGLGARPTPERGEGQNHPATSKYATFRETHGDVPNVAPPIAAADWNR